MKKRISFLLSLVIIAGCISPLTAFAINETSGSTDVSIELPLPTVDTVVDDTPSYSYVVNIPYAYKMTSLARTEFFEITATEMNIPEDKQVVVRIDNESTYESDGMLYLYLNGDKTSDNYICGQVDRYGDGHPSSIAMGPDNIVASFNPGELIPYDWQRLRVNITYFDSTILEAGTYTGTIYYTIGLE